MGSAERRWSWRHAVALPAAVLALLPLGLMLGGSLRPIGPPPADLADLFGGPFTVAPYGEAFRLGRLWLLLLNSLIVATLTVPLSVVVASSAGFAISRLPGRAAGPLLAASFVALMVPLTALLVGRFSLYAAIGATDSYVPLVAPALIGTSPLFVLLYYAAFRRLPAGLLDSARLDGASPFRTWLHIAMPLVWPVTIAVATLTFAASWGSFIEPLIYLFDAERFTLPLGLRSLAQLDAARTPVLLAAALVAAVPAIVAFVAAQRASFRELGL
jgi:multiple sugar transport system permease protein